jgi:hypothetical protein
MENALVEMEAGAKEFDRFASPAIRAREARFLVEDPVLYCAIEIGDCEATCGVWNIVHRLILSRDAGSVKIS